MISKILLSIRAYNTQIKKNRDTKNNLNLTKYFLKLLKSRKLTKFIVLELLINATNLKCLYYLINAIDLTY